MSITKCKMLEFPLINDSRGDLTFMENRRHIPFEIKRVFYIYNVPPGARRGGHAHKMLQEVIIPLSGSVDVLVDDGFEKNVYHLNKPVHGLYLNSMVWGEYYNFSRGTVLLVLASDHFDKSDYFRNYQEFLRAVRET